MPRTKFEIEEKNRSIVEKKRSELVIECCEYIDRCMLNGERKFNFRSVKSLLSKCVLEYSPIELSLAKIVRDPIALEKLTKAYAKCGWSISLEAKEKDTGLTICGIRIYGEKYQLYTLVFEEV